MISEKEIREEIKNMLDREKELIKEMFEEIKEDGDYSGSCLNELQTLYAQRCTLEWVLNEEESIEDFLEDKIFYDTVRNIEYFLRRPLSMEERICTNTLRNNIRKILNNMTENELQCWKQRYCKNKN